MPFNRRLALFLAAVVFAGVAGAYALSLWTDARLWLPIGISVASLAISILSAFKNELFDFAPQVVGGDFALIHSTAPNVAQSGLLLPVHFVNRGYGEGVIVAISRAIAPGSTVSASIISGGPAFAGKTGTRTTFRSSTITKESRP